LRAEFLTEHDRRHASVEELQAAVDAWVVEYNTCRPHQSCGGRPPAERFALAARSELAVVDEPLETVVLPRQRAASRPAGVSRWVNAQGRISLAGFDYPVGATFAGEPVEVVVSGGLVEVFHAGVLIATHVQRRARPATTGLTVTRIVDAGGAVSFAGVNYRCGVRWARQTVEVSIVAGSVQIAKDGQVIRVHPIRHDRSREFGAFANPKGRPDAPPPSKTIMSPTCRSADVVRVPEIDTSMDRLPRPWKAV
jgi:hypothetical protein